LMNRNLLFEVLKTIPRKRITTKYSVTGEPDSCSSRD